MYILTHQSLSTSASKLAYELNKLIAPKKLGVYFEPQSDAPTIRWGNSHGSYRTDTQFNSPKGIRIAGNKVAFSNFMGMIDIPFVELNSGTPIRYPVVIRTLLNASEGRGIVLAHNEEEFAPYKGNYWSYWYNFRYELGVHVFQGNIVKLFKKMLDKSEPEPDFPIRNLNKGYRYKRVRFEGRFDKLHPFVHKFYDEFDLEFYRADIGWDESSSCYRLIEVNTAPSLSNNENTLELYAKLLSERIF